MTREQLRQPVTAIRANAQFALRKVGADGVVDHAGLLHCWAAIVVETRRLDALLMPPEPLAADVMLAMCHASAQDGDTLAH
jgi:hypothetical protein